MRRCLGQARPGCVGLVGGSSPRRGEVLAVLSGALLALLLRDRPLPGRPTPGLSAQPSNDGPNV